MGKNIFENGVKIVMRRKKYVVRKERCDPALRKQLIKYVKAIDSELRKKISAERREHLERLRKQLNDSYILNK